MRVQLVDGGMHNPMHASKTHPLCASTAAAAATAESCLTDMVKMIMNGDISNLSAPALRQVSTQTQTHYVSHQRRVGIRV